MPSDTVHYFKVYPVTLPLKYHSRSEFETGDRGLLFRHDEQVRLWIDHQGVAGNDDCL